MVAKFMALEWRTNGTRFVRGEFGHIPKNTVKDKFGDYVRGDAGEYLCWQKNQLILKVKGEDGKVYSEDIYGHVKYVKTDIRVTQKLREKLKEKFRTTTFEVRNGAIFGIYDAIREVTG